MVSGDCHVVKPVVTCLLLGGQSDTRGNQYRFILISPGQPQKGWSGERHQVCVERDPEQRWGGRKGISLRKDLAWQVLWVVGIPDLPPGP